LNTKRNARISIMATKIMSSPTAIGLPQSPVWTPLTALRRIEVEKARLNATRSILVPENFPIQQLAEHPINILTLKPDDRTHFLSGLMISVIADGNVVLRKNTPSEH
jgi:hypothetical protein